MGRLPVPERAASQRPVPADPYLVRVGLPSAGASIGFDVHGAAGDVVTLFLGREAVVEPIPGVLIERLTSEERAIPLGAGGAATLTIALPPQSPPGFAFFAQARVLRGSEELRTNSIPVVVRWQAGSPRTCASGLDNEAARDSGRGRRPGLSPHSQVRGGLPGKRSGPVRAGQVGPTGDGADVP